MFQLLAVHTQRFGSQHLFMRTVDRVQGDVASHVRSPGLAKRRTPIALNPLSRKYGYITTENTGFMRSIQLDATVNVVNDQIQKLFVSRKIYGSAFVK